MIFLSAAYLITADRPAALPANPAPCTAFEIKHLARNSVPSSPWRVTDGTIATRGSVDGATIAALERIRESGRKFIRVTGRRMAEFAGVFPHLRLFDRIVAENRAVLYEPIKDATLVERVEGIQQAGLTA